MTSIHVRRWEHFILLRSASSNQANSKLAHPQFLFTKRKKYSVVVSNPSRLEPAHHHQPEQNGLDRLVVYRLRPSQALSHKYIQTIVYTYTHTHGSTIIQLLYGFHITSIYMLADTMALPYEYIPMLCRSSARVVCVVVR